jgi:hypothetical protein
MRGPAHDPALNRYVKAKERLLKATRAKEKAETEYTQALTAALAAKKELACFGIQAK